MYSLAPVLLPLSVSLPVAAHPGTPLPSGADPLSWMGAFVAGSAIGSLLPALASAVAAAVLPSLVEDQPAIRVRPQLLSCATLAGAVACVASVATFGVSMRGSAAWLLCCSLIVAGEIDRRHHLLPDCITLPLLWLGLLLNLGGTFAPLPDAVIGAAAGYVGLRAISEAISLAARAEGIGHGDFKLLAALGAWFGWVALPQVLTVAAVVCVMWALCATWRGRLKFADRIPFGPFLCLAGALTAFAGDQLVPAILR